MNPDGGTTYGGWTNPNGGEGGATHKGGAIMVDLLTTTQVAFVTFDANMVLTAKQCCLISSLFTPSSFCFELRRIHLIIFGAIWPHEDH